ncbi:ankyrin repeat-containing domain protein [Xylariaceae sp. FL1019]|nr:ankyrin repeat-containing domain protein [Xylariaceae sp. FL1019]
MASFSCLPNELLALIMEDRALSMVDLSNLTQTCKSLTHTATSILYRRDIRERQSSALIWAARNNQISTIRTALDLGADVQGVGLGEEDPDWIFTVIDQDDYCPGWEDREYGSPLHYAAMRGNDEIVALLIEHGAKLDAPSLNICRCVEHQYLGLEGDRDSIQPRWFPLHHAICHRQLSTADILFDSGAPLQMSYEAPDAMNLPPGPTVLHCAAAHGNHALVRRVLETKPGCLQSEPSWDGNELHYATECWESERVIDLLVAAGVDINHNYGGGTPIQRACWMGNFAAAMHILKAGANTPASLLHLAVCPRLPPEKLDVPELRESRLQEQLSFVRVLVEDCGYKVDQELTATHDYVRLRLSHYISATPLHVVMSQEWENPESPPHLVKYLLEKGADPQHLFDRRLAMTSAFGCVLEDEYYEHNPQYKREIPTAWEVIRIFLHNGARIGYGGDDDVETPPIWIAFKSAFDDKPSKHALSLTALLLEESLPGALSGDTLEEILEVLEGVTDETRLAGDADNVSKLNCVHGMIKDYMQRNPVH